MITYSSARHFGTLALRTRQSGYFILLLFVSVLLEAASLRGQTLPESEEPISTDRPSVANSSVVVPKGAIQIENGLLITSAQSQWVLDAPESSLRYGFLTKTELRLSIPDYIHGILDSTTPSGFGDTVIGVKQQIGPLGRGDLSLIVFLSLPSGAKGVSNHGYDPALQLPWSVKLSENWTTGGQVAFYWPTQAGQHTFTGESTFLFDRQLTKRWDAFIEYAGDFSERGGPRHLLHFGSSYKLAPRHQIDFHTSVGASGAAPDSFFGIGYSFLFRRKK